MKKMNFQEVVKVKFQAVEDFSWEGIVAMHEYLPDDPEFRRRVLCLYRLVSELKMASDELMEA